MVWMWWWIAGWVKAWFAGRFHRRCGGRRRKEAAPVFCRAQSKPAWVTREVIRLKALMPEAGCRMIADTFNRRFALDKRMTVGKSYVADIIRKHEYEIQVLRKRIKHAKPRPIPRNLVWAMDLTGKTDACGVLHMLLGIVDHGSRAALCLQALRDKSSWTLLGHLFLAIGKYGKPKFLRTDNEAVLTSRLFRGALRMAGIHHQRSDPGCPWQNGRVERFFGTLKSRLDSLSVANFASFNLALEEFRFWYNHVRPHRNLDGVTPAEAWAGVNPFAAKIKGEYWFEAWEGLLRGFYLRR